MSSPSDLDLLVDSTLYDPKYRDTAVVPGAVHRLNLNRLWSIPPGSSLLDVGCGQGESSLALALAVGPDGHVTGIDPGPPDYGAPFTIGESQAHVLKSEPLGRRIAFKRAEPISLLRSASGDDERFDAAVCCHSLWYFPSLSAIQDLFAALAAAGVRRAYLAEWTGGEPSTSDGAQEPHRRAAALQKRLFTLGVKGTETQNVRVAPTPDELVSAAERGGGWRVAKNGTIAPPREMMDGHWEVRLVLAESLAQKIRESGLDDDTQRELLQEVERVREAEERVKREGGLKLVPCMDVFWAVLELRE